MLNNKVGGKDFSTEPSQEVFGLANWSGQSKDKLNWGVFNGDSLDILRTLPNECVNCVVTSPPYFWLRDYGVDGQIGLEDTIEEYVSVITNIMDEVKRVLKKDGTLFLNIGDTYYSGKGASQGKDRKSNKRRFGLRAVDKSGGMGIGLQRKSIIGIPWRVGISLSTNGWVLRSPIIWHRENRLPEHVRDRPSRSYEYVLMCVKNRKYFFNKQPLIDKKIEEDMWTIAAKPKSKGLETAPYPDELVRRCLEIGCPEGGVVLDPFLGSGTTSRVALEMGLHAIGIELNTEFCSHSVSNLREF